MPKRNHNICEDDNDSALDTVSSPKFWRIDSDDEQSTMPTDMHDTPSSPTAIIAPASTIITCTLPSCPTREFATSEDYEVHYAKLHTNRCIECHKNFPSLRIMECHIKETHDMLAQLKKEKGEKIYECFVEDCDRLCSTWSKRRMHVIDKHGYPKDFNFNIVYSGMDHSHSLLKSPTRKSKTRIRSPSDVSMSVSNGNEPMSPTRLRRQSKLEASKEGVEESMEVDSEKVDMADIPSKITTNSKGIEQKGIRQKPEKTGVMDVDTGEEVKKEVDEDDVMSDLTSKLASIKMVPTSIKFGRRGPHSGFSKK